MLLAFAYFFCLLSSYFILRPIRDAMAVAAGVSKLPWLWAGTLSAMLVANPLFSALVARFPNAAERLVPLEQGSNFRDIGYIEFEKDNLAAKVNELFRELIGFGLITVSVGAGAM